jgi:hypothetical protein
MLGEQHQIRELTELEVSVNVADGHTLSMIASRVCPANACFRCPYEGGALFVLIKDENFPRCTEPPLQRIATIFPQAISSLNIPNHPLAFSGYLDDYGLAYERDQDQIVVKENGVPVLTASFDEQDRLAKLEATLTRDSSA